MGDGPLPKPHGTPTFANTLSGVLTRGGFARYLVRRNIAYGGHHCTWDRDQKLAWVRYRNGDDTPESQWGAERKGMLDQYEEFLKVKGYRVERPAELNSLFVYPKDTAKKA